MQVWGDLQIGGAYGTSEWRRPIGSARGDLGPSRHFFGRLVDGKTTGTQGDTDENKSAG